MQVVLISAAADAGDDDRNTAMKAHFRSQALYKLVSAMAYNYYCYDLTYIIPHYSYSLCRNRDRDLQTSKAPLESQAHHLIHERCVKS